MNKRDCGKLVLLALVCLAFCAAPALAEWPSAIDAKITAPDGRKHDDFGKAVAISGNTAIVGAPYDDDKGTSSGSAYIFYRDGSEADDWSLAAKITANGRMNDGLFGYAVSVSGDTAIVGAFGDEEKGRLSGSAFIFSRDQGGADNWGLVKKIFGSDTNSWDRFGVSVSVSGDTAIVGSSGSGSTGSAYIFCRDEGGVDNWGQVKKITGSGVTSSGAFGVAVFLEGDTAIVGSDNDDAKADGSGSAHVFSRNEGGADNWGQVAKLMAEDSSRRDHFGGAVSLSGDTAVVGAEDDDPNGMDSGSAYIFYRDQGGADNWGQVKKVVADDGQKYDYFGSTVSVSGDTAIVGAHGDDDMGSQSGSVFVYSRDEGGADNWGRVKQVTASDGVSGDGFGCAVALSGDTAIVGAVGDDDKGSGSGSAYVLEPYVPGDVNGDDALDISDYRALRLLIGKKDGGAGYEKAADMNGDGTIWYDDLRLLIRALRKR